MEYSPSLLLYFAITILVSHEIIAADFAFYNATTTPLTLKMYSKNSKIKVTTTIPLRVLTKITYKPKHRVKLELLNGSNVVKTITDAGFLEKYRYFTITKCDQSIVVGGTNSAAGQATTTCKSQHFSDEEYPYPIESFTIETR